MTSSAVITSPSASDPTGKIVLKIRAYRSGAACVPDDVVPVLCLSGLSARFAWPTTGIGKVKHKRIRFKMRGHKRWACDWLGFLPN